MKFEYMMPDYKLRAAISGIGLAGRSGSGKPPKVIITEGRVFTQSRPVSSAGSWRNKTVTLDFFGWGLYHASFDVIREMAGGVGGTMDEPTTARSTGRRSALKKMALGAGAAWFPILGQAVTPAMARAAQMHPAGPDAPAPDPDWKPLFFDEHQNATVEALSELIIPATTTPGAKAALVNRYIDLLLADEDADKQKEFYAGLAWLDARSIQAHHRTFVSLSPAEQTALLEPLADPANSRPEDKPGVEFLEQMKDLTIFGYYTSKIGLEQELEYGGDDYHTEFPGACTHSEH
jgi:glucoside 3-dehydrogenase (cytochrome c) hitch-hiker subunit